MLAGSVVLLCRDLPYPHGEYRNGISQHLPLPIKTVKMPDRAYDKHTAAGRKKGRGIKHFFNEATSLKNERFVNNWEDAGKTAYFIADGEKLGKTAKIIEAIKKGL